MQPEENELYRDLIEWLKKSGYFAFRIMPDGSLSALHNFIFTYGLCSHVDWHRPYKGRWCFEKENLPEALLALEEFDGINNPPGPWLKYKGEGAERHNPNKYKKDKHGLYRRTA